MSSRSLASSPLYFDELTARRSLCPIPYYPAPNWSTTCAAALPCTSYRTSIDVHETQCRQVGEHDHHDILQYLVGNRRTAQAAYTGLCRRKQPRMVRLQCQYRQDGVSKRHSSPYSYRTQVYRRVNALRSVLISLVVDRSNWQDWGGRWARRNEFMHHLKNVLEELDVRYMLPIQPVLLPSGPPAPGHAQETNA